MAEKIEMATVSSRGQICIPNEIREDMGLREGSKVLFMLTGDSLIMKKVGTHTFRDITAPLKDAAKRAGLRRSDVSGMIHGARLTAVASERVLARDWSGKEEDKAWKDL